MKAWDAFVEEVHKAKAEMDFRDGEECFYRGERDSSWNLEPSLFRIESHKGRDAELLTLEYDLFFEFRARARELHHEPLIDWEWMFHMRHHGLPTRLLDWTESLGVAVYFAIKDLLRSGDAQSARPACVWILNPYTLNKLACGDRDLVAPEYLGYHFGKIRPYSKILLSRNPRFGWKCPIAIYPSQKVERMHAQRGWFTIHGDDRRPLNKILSTGRHEKILRRIPIPPDAIEGANDFLQIAGINAYSLFPDLDGLSEELRRKYVIAYRDHRSPRPRP